MSRKIICFMLLLFFGVLLPVHAEEYKIGELIPARQPATVHTEKFDYIDFSYSSGEDNGVGVVSFQEIHNNNIAKTSVSINLLLFGKDKKNIGLVSYCSDKDYGENFGFKLNGGLGSPYSIYIGENYLVDGKGPNDIYYIAIYDDNHFCSISLKNKYEGLTIEEIFGEPSPNKNNFSFSFLNNSNAMFILLVVIVTLTFLGIFGLILNCLYPKMYTTATLLVYLPIANFFICVKMAFGKIVAFIYLGLLVAAGVLFYFHIPILAYIMGGFTLLAFLVVIIKIVTKKYDLFYLEPTMETFKEPSPSVVVEQTNQAPLDLSYSDEGLNIDGENEVENNDPLRDVYDDVINSDHDDFDDDFYSSDDE